MCAKVSGPLMSMDARGKLANAIVFSYWKGVNSVRKWLVPKNPQSGDQGDQRLILGGTGRACGAVKPTSGYAGQLITLGVIPSTQSKQSYLVKKIIDSYLSTPTLYEAIVTEFNAHSAKTDFTSGAVTAGLTDLDIAYKGTTSAFAKGIQLYLLAKVAIALGFTGSPYDTALASWTATEVGELVADLAAV